MDGVSYTHRAALSKSGGNAHDPDPLCPATLIRISSGFWGDCSWAIFGCPRCRVKIASAGYAHWWNYTIGPWRDMDSPPPPEHYVGETGTVTPWGALDVPFLIGEGA